ncbi:MAG: hypothetical protein WAX07_02290 [Candidatus Altiarchaeia archaeon]
MDILLPDKPGTRHEHKLRTKRTKRCKRNYPFSGQFKYSSTLGAVSESTIGDSSVFATDKCALIGDASPCGVVGIPEVIDVITQWSSDEATLADVIFSLLFIFPIHKINILRSLRLIFKTSGVNPI